MEMPAECQFIQKNMDHCNCSYPGCPRKGNCCECVRYHRVRNQLPACYFSTKAEKTYDRSVAFFIKEWRKA